MCREIEKCGWASQKFIRERIGPVELMVLHQQYEILRTGQELVT